MIKIARINRLWICLDLQTGCVYVGRRVKDIIEQLRGPAEQLKNRR